ncbi:MAG TPA: adenylyltransferase [Thermoplasmata archaeon]|jgi:molybdopterin/thiamine biosynthesis adenylyltransferase|nr:MAG TPA: adenylyltransferase [Thermoplasmata archaeon]
MNLERYRRQILVKEFGQRGQETLSKKNIVIIGGGGLGSNSANIFVRMGIGTIDIIDKDTIDITNLHRTSLFTQEDVGKSKALILEERLHAINPEAHIRGINQKITKENIESFVKNADVIVDGTDSVSLRHLINNVSLHYNIPWVYAGVYETVGMIMGVLPQKTPCFQCISQNIPESIPGEIPVLGSLPATIASIQCNETIKLLLGKPLAGLIIYDVWDQCFDVMNIKRNPDCPVCGKK